MTTVFETITKILYTNSKWILICLVSYYDSIDTDYVLYIAIKDLTTPAAWIANDIDKANSKINPLDVYVQDNTDDDVNVQYVSYTPVNRVYINPVDTTDGSSLSFFESITFTDEDSSYSGSLDINTMIYYFVCVTAAGFLYYSFDGTTFTLEETITTLTNPTTWNLDVQQYWRQGNSEWIMDEDHFYVRELGDTTWASYSDTGTTTNGIIWYYNTAGEYQISFVIWKDTIYKINAQGFPVKLQQTAVDAYVGWGSTLGDAWFANGTDTIYQYTLAADTTFQKAEINTALYLPPKADLISLTAPFQDQYLMLYDDRDTLLYEGFVQSYEYNTEQYRYLMQSGADIDYKEKVDASYTSQTAHAILKDVIDTYCRFLHYSSTSISTTPSSTYTISFKGKTVLDVMRWVDNQEGYITSVRPDLTVHWDQFVDGFVGEDHKYGVEGVVQWGTAAVPNLEDWITNIDTFQVIEIDGKKNALNCYSTTSLNRAVLPLSSTQTSGTMEFLIHPHQNDRQFYVGFSNGSDEADRGNYICRVAFLADGNIDFQGSTSGTDLVAYSANVWIHCKVTFIKNGSCTLTVNGSLLSTITGNNFDADYLFCYIGTSNVGFDLDAFGFSWDGYVADTNRFKTINDQTPPGITFTPTLKSTATKYSRIVVWGGYVNGVQLKSTVLGEPNYGTWQDWFPEITDQTTLDALAAQEAADKNVVIQKMKLGVRTTGQFNVGTSFQNNISQYSISDETWYVLSVKYDAIINESKFVAADSYLSPSPQEHERVAVQQNTRLTKQNEQNVGSLEELVAQQLALGSANAQWKPCVFRLETVVGKVYSSGGRTLNVDATDVDVEFTLPLEPTRGSLKLYISEVKINLMDADGTDYLEAINIYSTEGTTLTTEFTDTNEGAFWQSAQIITESFTAIDCSAFDSVTVRCNLFCTTVNEVIIGGVLLKYYYDT